MFRKVLITVWNSDISPRFDLTSEVVIVALDDQMSVIQERTVVLPHASAEELCHLILTEEAGLVICGGIEEEYHQYLTWKKVEVLDSVMGPWVRALEQFRAGELAAGSICYDGGSRQADA